MDETQHVVAWDVDNLVTPFQCDLCMFRNLKVCNPGSADMLLKECIRQVTPCGVGSL
jgi:hypothetical protein